MQEKDNKSKHYTDPYNACIQMRHVKMTAGKLLFFFLIIAQVDF